MFELLVVWETTMVTLWLYMVMLWLYEGEERGDDSCKSDIRSMLCSVSTSGRQERGSPGSKENSLQGGGGGTGS